MAFSLDVCAVWTLWIILRGPLPIAPFSRYHRLTPPEYNLSAITTPLAMFTGILRTKLLLIPKMDFVNPLIRGPFFRWCLLTFLGLISFFCICRILVFFKADPSFYVSRPIFLFSLMKMVANKPRAFNLPASQPPPPGKLGWTPGL